uniref:Uncharacterized protein n=1 Tax=Tetranychus urticae TaxID=32264 RepID=T1K6X5_TETUR
MIVKAYYSLPEEAKVKVKAGCKAGVKADDGEVTKKKRKPWMRIKMAVELSGKLAQFMEPLSLNMRQIWRSQSSENNNFLWNTPSSDYFFNSCRCL